MPANQATLGRLEAVLARLETVATKLGIEGTPKKGSTQSAADIQALVGRLEAAADKIEQSTPGAEGIKMYWISGESFYIIVKIKNKTRKEENHRLTSLFVVLGSGKTVEFYDEVSLIYWIKSILTESVYSLASLMDL